VDDYSSWQRAAARKKIRPVQLAMGVSQREYGTNGNNGTNGSSQTVFKPFSVCSLMSGHIFKIGFASQANPGQQKNGRQKNSDETAADPHFSASHFSAVLFVFRVFTNVS
jgi:hypothetical protein